MCACHEEEQIKLSIQVETNLAALRRTEAAVERVKAETKGP